MAKRITIMIDDDLDRKLRLKQSQQIKKSKKSVSYSRVVNQTRRKIGKIIFQFSSFPKNNFKPVNN